MLITAQEDFAAFFQTNSKSDLLGDFGDNHIKLWDHVNSMQ